MHWVSPKNFFPNIPYALRLFLLLATAGMVFSGCAEYSLKSPAPEVKTFFVAGQEADVLGAICLSPGSADLSAYTHLTGVQYPPTLKVDVLKQPPALPYKSFAVLECASGSDSTPDAVMAGLQSKARGIGADAIIICQPGLNPGLPGLPPSAKMQAVAIKYKILGRSNRENNP